MAEFPALPLFTDAYLADTRHLNAQQHGAYMLLLIMAWRQPDCALPNDDKTLARWAAMDSRTWQRHKGVVLSFWRLGEDNRWRQGRLSDERKYVADVISKKSAAGRSSALKRKNRVTTPVVTEREQKSDNSGATDCCKNVDDVNNIKTATQSPIILTNNDCDTTDVPTEGQQNGNTHTHTHTKEETRSSSDNRNMCAAPENSAIPFSLDSPSVVRPDVSSNGTGNRSHEKSECEGWFSEAWAKWLKHVSRAAALKVYLRVVTTKKRHDEVMVGIDRFNAHFHATGSEIKFVPNFATWLNQERWNDEYAVSDSSQSTRRPLMFK